MRWNQALWIEYREADFKESRSHSVVICVYKGILYSVKYLQRTISFDMENPKKVAPLSKLLTIATFILLLFITKCSCGITSQYRRELEASIDMPLDSDVFKEPEGYNAPQQVHITQGDFEGRSMIISWITPIEAGSGIVSYGLESGNYQYSSRGKTLRYRFYNYTSGFIHHCNIKNLEYDTTYYYKLGEGNVEREFWFKTAPKPGPDASYKFGIIGDLGQTYDSNKTFQHYLKSDGQTLLFVGDLSYADHYPFYFQVRWDSWGRFIEPSAAYQPWIWTAGNHEIDILPDVHEIEPFKSFTHRFHVPYKSSNSTSPLWYSIRRASAHIIVLSSYSAFGTYTPQWRWLQNELTRVDRKVTPWLIVLMHSPFYNSNGHHYMEGETMRVQFEEWFVNYKVDIVFAGHVHAYERSHHISNVAYNIVNGLCTPTKNNDAPVYITVGDGGNIEGLAMDFMDPQPNYSAFREASFGHGILDIMNRTHAVFYWHRNQDGNAEEADSYMFINKFWNNETSFIPDSSLLLG